jgi:tripartite-type tricarboxylate transporter receptor subunit TctC
MMTAALLALPGLAAFAQPAAGFPRKPIKLVVPYAPGSGTDTVARILSQALQTELGVPVIVDNRPGANGTIGSDYVAKSAPDGYTLLLGGSSTHSSAPGLFKKLPYDPVHDFEMLANVVESQFFLVVRGDSPMHSVAELKAKLKADQTTASYGFGSATAQIAGTAFVKRSGFMATAVPYKSNPPAITDLIGGIVDFIFVDQTTALPQIKGGMLRALAVASPQRMTEYPDVPTLAEAGLGEFNIQTWLGVLAPRGITLTVADKLSAALGDVMTKDAVRVRLAATGKPLMPTPRSGFAAFLKIQQEAWSAKIREAGIQPE